MVQQFVGLVKQIIQVFIYIIAPPVCYMCHTFMLQQSIVCDDCDRQLLPIAPKLLQINKKYTMIIHAICRYDGPIKRMILAKHHSDHVVIHGLADLMWNKTVLSYIKVDCFIPVPLHWTRQLKRGFNQAYILAKRIAQYKNVPVYNMLKRIKATEYQARLEKFQRDQNVKEAFIVAHEYQIQGKHVVLVDDLCTTGSTAVAAAKILAQYQPASISLVVACRAL